MIKRVVVGTGYMVRWHLLPRNSLFNVYLHRIEGRDRDIELHDHSWWSLTVVLKGSYEEVVLEPGAEHPYYRKVKRFSLRSPKTAHRILRPEVPTWTLFITGPRVREWGFHTINGWVHWRQYLGSGNDG